jgi:hypothetical protein
MIDVPYCLLFKFVPRKQNWAALPLVNTYFSFPNSQVKNNKKK